MAEKAKRIRTQKQQEKLTRFAAVGKKMPRATRVYHRCELCGRVRGYIGFFRMCRICLRFMAREGKIAGLKKSSW